MTDLSLLQVILANLALLAGACLQGVAGYGIGTLAAPLLFLISPTLVPAPLILNAVVLTVFMLSRNRAALQLRQVRFALGGGVAGTVLAALTLMLISPKGFELAFGVLILIGVALSAGGLRPALNARNSVLAGAASTYMGQRELQLFAVTFPGVLIGFWLSGKLINRLSFDGLRPIILGIAAIAGVAALVRGLVSL